MEYNRHVLQTTVYVRPGKYSLCKMPEVLERLPVLLELPFADHPQDHPEHRALPDLLVLGDAKPQTRHRL